MSSRNITRGFVLFIVALSVLTSVPVLGNVVVFDKYETSMTLVGDTLQVTKVLRLMNVGVNPIIPGEIHFKLSQHQDGQMVPADVKNLEIIDHYKKAIDSKALLGSESLDIVFTIWDPLLPSFYYDFTMKYEMDFEPRGLLFYEINLPQEKTTITIKDKKTTFTLPKRYHVTYAPGAEIESMDNARVITWFDTSDLDFEYSYLPLPRLGVRMVNVFWIVLICLSLIYLVFRYIRSRKSVDDR